MERKQLANYFDDGLIVLVIFQVKCQTFAGSNFSMGCFFLSFMSLWVLREPEIMHSSHCGLYLHTSTVYIPHCLQSL